jgi:hypothetical protein
MGETINLFKNVYTKEQFEKVVDTSFPVTVEEQVAAQQLPTVAEFFQYYYALFYQIPKTGTDSHTTLITTSQEYVGVETNQEIQALLQEINTLQATVLEQQKVIFTLTATTGSNG